MTATLMGAPERPLTQREAALRQANKVRFYRANLKRDIALGRTHLDELLLGDVDERLQTMPVADLLKAVPGVGQERTRKMLVHLLHTSLTVKLGALSRAQRERLSHVVWDHRQARACRRT